MWYKELTLVARKKTQEPNRNWTVIGSYNCKLHQVQHYKALMKAYFFLHNKIDEPDAEVRIIEKLKVRF